MRVVRSVVQRVGLLAVDGFDRGPVLHLLSLWRVTDAQGTADADATSDVRRHTHADARPFWCVG
jgi:hypothetical protein